jgi:hypothetical protein
MSLMDLLRNAGRDVEDTLKSLVESLGLIGGSILEHWIVDPILVGATGKKEAAHNLDITPVTPQQIIGSLLGIGDQGSVILEHLAKNWGLPFHGYDFDPSRIGKYAYEHPVSFLLDILPVAGAGYKAVQGAKLLPRLLEEASPELSDALWAAVRRLNEERGAVTLGGSDIQRVLKEGATELVPTMPEENVGSLLDFLTYRSPEHFSPPFEQAILERPTGVVEKVPLVMKQHPGLNLGEVAASELLRAMEPSFLYPEWGLGRISHVLPPDVLLEKMVINEIPTNPVTTMALLEGKVPLMEYVEDLGKGSTTLFDKLSHTDPNVSQLVSYPYTLEDVPDIESLIGFLRESPTTEQQLREMLAMDYLMQTHDVGWGNIQPLTLHNWTLVPTREPKVVRFDFEDAFEGVGQGPTMMMRSLDLADPEFAARLAQLDPELLDKLMKLYAWPDRYQTKLRGALMDMVKYRHLSDWLREQLDNSKLMKGLMDLAKERSPTMDIYLEAYRPGGLTETILSEYDRYLEAFRDRLAHLIQTGRIPTGHVG